MNLLNKFYEETEKHDGNFEFEFDDMQYSILEKKVGKASFLYGARIEKQKQKLHGLMLYTPFTIVAIKREERLYITDIEFFNYRKYSDSKTDNIMLATEYENDFRKLVKAAEKEYYDKAVVNTDKYTYDKDDIEKIRTKILLSENADIETQNICRISTDEVIETLCYDECTVDNVIEKDRILKQKLKDEMINKAIEEKLFISDNELKLCEALKKCKGTTVNILLDNTERPYDLVVCDRNELLNKIVYKKGVCTGIKHHDSKEIAKVLHGKKTIYVRD